MSELQKKQMGRPVGVVTFPYHPLNEALKIPTAIWEHGGGKPMALQDVADYTLTESGAPYKFTSHRFGDLVRAANRYNLIEGSYNNKATQTIGLSPLGRSIVAPTANVDVNAAMRTALETPEVFKGVLESFHGAPIPAEKIFLNTLVQEYHVRQQDAKTCYDVLMKNIQELKISKNNILRLDNLSATIGATKPTKEDESESEEPESGTGVQEIIKQPAEVIPPEEKQVTKQIFVAHGKNKKPLEQLERILIKFKTVKYRIATEEANRGLPVSGKVAELMKECTSGIFIFTADEETKDVKGNTVWRPSDNVVYELGAASVLYGRKIVIFKEEDVAFASDFSDIGYIPFEKDRLDAKTADLMLELINLGFMQLMPT